MWRDKIRFCYSPIAHVFVKSDTVATLLKIAFVHLLGFEEVFAYKWHLIQFRNVTSYFIIQLIIKISVAHKFLCVTSHLKCVCVRARNTQLCNPQTFWITHKVESTASWFRRFRGNSKHMSFNLISLLQSWRFHVELLPRMLRLSNIPSSPFVMYLPVNHKMLSSSKDTIKLLQF